MKQYKLTLVVEIPDNLDIGELTFKQLPRVSKLMDLTYKEIKIK